MTVELFESQLIMHKYGIPPHDGLGLGLERFTAILPDFENVHLPLYFPNTPALNRNIILALCNIFVNRLHSKHKTNSIITQIGHKKMPQMPIL